MCQPGGGRWALGFGDRKHRRTAVETRSAAALGQQVLCCRWSARGSIKRAPASQQPAAPGMHHSPPTSSHWEERRARTALRAQPVTAQIWPSFQLERQPPPAGGLLIHQDGVDSRRHNMHRGPLYGPVERQGTMVSLTTAHPLATSEIALDRRGLHGLQSRRRTWAPTGV